MPNKNDVTCCVCDKQPAVIWTRGILVCILCELEIIIESTRHLINKIDKTIYKPQNTGVDYGLYRNMAVKEIPAIQTQPSNEEKQNENDSGC